MHLSQYNTALTALKLHPFDNCYKFVIIGLLIVLNVDFAQLIGRARISWFYI